LDSIEVAVRFTEAIMAKSNTARNNKGADLAEQYVDMFTEVLKRLDAAMPHQAAPLPPTITPRATSDIFPLTHER